MCGRCKRGRGSEERRERRVQSIVRGQACTEKAEPGVQEKREEKRQAQQAAKFQQHKKKEIEEMSENVRQHKHAHNNEDIISSHYWHTIFFFTHSL